MTGGGSVFTPDHTRVTHGFELHCDPSQQPNNLEINWPANIFHLTSLTTATCFFNPTLLPPNPPKASFNTYQGTGTGDLNGVPGARRRGPLPTRGNLARTTPLRTRLETPATPWF
jgi:hypothetical protein